MKITEGVRSNIYPKEIEINDSSNPIVYVRSNITKLIEKDLAFGTEVESYSYTETEYTLAEWCNLQFEDINNKINNIMNILTNN